MSAQMLGVTMATTPREMTGAERTVYRLTAQTNDAVGHMGDRITALEAENAELRRRVEAAELKALVYDRISEHGFTLRFDKGQTLGDCFAAGEAGR